MSICLAIYFSAITKVSFTAGKIRVPLILHRSLTHYISYRSNTPDHPAGSRIHKQLF